MQTTIQIKLYLTNEQKKLIKNTMQEYVVTVNRTIADFVEISGIDKRTTKDVKANIPSALINQAISDAKSIFKKYKKACISADRWNKKKYSSEKQKTATIPILRKPMAIWNNQNWKINDNSISFPVWSNGKCQRISVKAIIPIETLERLTNSKLGTIRLEKLANIRKTARTSRKNEKNLHTWSFYRLAQYIEYKANLLGIEVQYVNPAYTSQICPCCGTKNHANDRKYICACGFHGHRDIVGARNIINAPVASGNSLSA